MHAIPRKTFRQSLVELTRPVDRKLLEKFAARLGATEDYQTGAAILTEFMDQASAQLNNAINAPSTRLVLQDPAIVAAWTSIIRSVKNVAVNYSYSDMLNDVLDQVNPLFSHARRPLTGERLQQILDARPLTHAAWATLIVAALDEYFYDDAMLIRAEQNRTKMEELEASILAGARSLRELTELATAEGGNAGALANLADNYESTILHRLNRQLFELRKTLPPPIRQGETERERLLVFRFWQAHRWLFNASKSAALYELMTFQGVRSIDRRNIDRACQAFAGHISKAYVATQYRRLLQRIRAESAGAEC